MSPSSDMGDSESVRKIEVYESPENGKWLHDNQYNLQIAMAVCKGDGSPIFNIIWESRQVSPTCSISWKPVYGLNWTADVPAPGVSVTLFGLWQECKKGQVFNIDNSGYWQQGDRAKGDPEFMTIGKIDYSNPQTDGIHIVIGIKNSKGGFDTIFCDQTAIAKNSLARYQPREEVQLWYQAGVRTCTMKSEVNTSVLELDLSKSLNNTGQFCRWATFDRGGTWTERATSPPNPDLAPLASTEFSVVPPK